MNTKISYLCRDADNYKRYNECIVAGTLSANQICTILDCCDMASILSQDRLGFQNAASIPTIRKPTIVGLSWVRTASRKR